MVKLDSKIGMKNKLIKNYLIVDLGLAHSLKGSIENSPVSLSIIFIVEKTS